MAGHERDFVLTSRHLGDQPAVVRVKMDGASVEIAANSADTELLLGPYRKEVA
jgi:hypothetical protein